MTILWGIVCFIQLFICLGSGITLMRHERGWKLALGILCVFGASGWALYLYDLLFLDK